MDKVKVIISNEQKEVAVPTGIRLLIRRCCHAVLQEEDFHDNAEVSVSFVNNEQIHELNKKYRNVDRETDVLSFPLGENGEYDTNLDTGAKPFGRYCYQRSESNGAGKSLQPFASKRNRLFNRSFNASPSRLRP